MPRKFGITTLLMISVGLLWGVRIGYAFSGGGAKGIAHIGMLKVLEEAGLHPDFISGTSIGALVGGLYAMGYNAVEIESLCVNTDWAAVFNDDWQREELYVGLKRWAPYGNAYFRLDKNWSPQLPRSLISGTNINLQLFRLFSPAAAVSDFADLPIPFSAIATDLVSGEQTVFDSGSLMEGIRASMSLSSILQPFPLDKTLYIDGGLSQNLPGKQVKEMGADYVIGFKVNTALQPEKKLNDLIAILEQTINIGITHKINDDILYCDYLLEPDLDLYPARNFKNIQAIIDAGEQYAREHWDELVTIREQVLSPDTLNIHNPQMMCLEPQYPVCRTVVFGNEYLSSSIIRDYSGLQSGQSYSVEEIIKGIRQAWNTQMFDIIYPVLEKEDFAYLLKIKVRERERKHIFINLAYDSDNEFVAGLILSLHNYLMKNSLLLAELKLGGKNEFNLDFVKNFGQAFGVYYRIFPYLEEKRIYFYDDDHNKKSSARSLEYGVTAGLGMFAYKSAVIEGYGFASSTRMYREIALTDSSLSLNRLTVTSGLGIKGYNENLDDYTFPTRGTRTFIKFTANRNNKIKDQTVNRLQSRFEIYYPLTVYFSALLDLQLGSHFRQNDQTNLHPFYLGGMDCFGGFQKYEKSAPFYELLQAGLIAFRNKSLFLKLKFQALHYSGTDTILPEKDFILGGVLEAGYKSHLGPVKIALAVAEQSQVQYYLALGYTNDAFHLSRH